MTAVGITHTLSLPRPSLAEQLYGRSLALPPQHSFSRLQRFLRGISTPCSLPQDQLQHNFLFIHVPKTGGKSIEQSLSLAARGHVPIAYFLLRHPRVAQKAYSFAFVRNPYDRLVSAFFYLKRGGGNHADKRWADRMLSGILTLEDFVAALQCRRFREGVLSGVHFRPQIDFVCALDGRLFVTFIGRFERLAADYQLVTQRLGLQAVLPHVNRSNRERSWSNVFKKPAFRDVIIAMYRADFLTFGYDAHSWDERHDNPPRVDSAMGEH